MRRLLATALAALALAGCAELSLYNRPFDRPKDTTEVSSRFRTSPSVRKISSQAFSPRTSVDRIELHYHWFNVLNAPNAIANWTYHWKIAEGSNPAWKYVEIAEVVSYMPRHDDSAALQQIRETAASLGGDGVVDLLREPITVSEMGNRILGYAYRGVVVRREGSPE